MIERVIRQVFFHAACRVDHAVFVDEREALQMEQLFHLRLICLQVYFILQIVLRQQTDRCVDDVDVVVQVLLEDLRAPACQLVQIQFADGTRGFDRIFLRAAVHQDRAEDQDRGHEDAACDHDAHGSVLPPGIHSGIPPLSIR